MPRKPSKRKSTKRNKSKSSSGKRTRTYPIVKPAIKLSPRPLVGFWQVRGGTILSLLLLAAFGLIMSQFFTTYRFYVYEVKVRGNQFVDPQEIYDVSGLHELSIFWINPDKVEAAILSNLLGVKEATVTCRLPNRVTIEVVERQMKVVWRWGEKRYGVDEQGAILPLEGEWEGMLLIQDLTSVPPEVRHRIDPEVIRSALELQKFLPETAVLQYSDDRGLSFHQEGYPIYLGKGDMAEKMKIVNALVQSLASDGIQPQFVDVRFPESPYYQ
jgi:cell division septal protein FtsQ